MRSSAKTITTIVFLAVLLGCGLSILYLGTSTGLIFGGAKTVTNSTTTTTPMYAEVGWLQNTSPWPITITRITANAVNATKAPSVYVEHGQDSSTVKPGKVPLWVKTSATLPYELVGGDIRFLGFGISPATGQIASFRSITVSFRGPLGFSFQKTFGGTDIAAASATLPSGLIARNPATDAGSLDGYITMLRTGLGSDDTGQLATIMGGDATATDAAAFAKAQSGYTSSYRVVASRINEAPGHIKLIFYKTDPTKDALPPITVTWAHYRWSVDRG